MAMRPKTLSSGPVQEVVWTGDDIDLGKLPIQTCWPGEPAPLITWPLVVTQGPDPDGKREDAFNLGIYRMQVTGPKSTYMRWLKHRGGGASITPAGRPNGPSRCQRPPSSAPIRARSSPR